MNLLLVRLRSPKIVKSLLRGVSALSNRIESPPRRLLRIAASVPHHWGKQLVDLRGRGLNAEDLDWTDCAILDSSLEQQRECAHTVRSMERSAIELCSSGPGNPASRRHVSLGELRLPLRLQPVPNWRVADLSQYSSVSIPLHSTADESLSVRGDFGSSSVEEMRSADEIIEELNHLYVAGWRKHIHLFTSVDGESDTDWMRRVFERLERWRLGKTLGGLSADLCASEMAARAVVTQAVDAGITDVYLRFPLDAEDTNGLQSEDDLIAFLKFLQRAGIQVRGGMPITQSDVEWEESLEQAARLHALKLDRLLAQLLGAPLELGNRVRALRVVGYLGKSLREMQRIVADIARTRIRSPQLLSLAATIAIYSEAYRLLERVV